ncbi:MAG: STAS domain-containing protein [Spirochaetales bacterium]|nr:STAS domain-containing protein [Spirochaetales bacterium]
MLKIVEEQHSDCVRLRLSGHLDLESTGDLKRALDGCLARAAHQVRVHLGLVDHISSGGVGALMHFHSEFARKGGALLLESPSASCLHALEMLGLSDFFKLVRAR